MCKQASAVLLLLLLTTSPAQQSSNTPFIRFLPASFLNAGQFSDLPPVEKNGYAKGFLNGLMAAGMLGADIEKVEMLHRCTREMNDVQIAAILDKYIKDHPEGWHEPLAIHSFNALLGVCPDLKKRFETERLGNK